MVGRPNYMEPKSHSSQHMGTFWKSQSWHCSGSSFFYCSSGGHHLTYLCSTAIVLPVYRVLSLTTIQHFSLIASPSTLQSDTCSVAPTFFKRPPEATLSGPQHRFPEAQVQEQKEAPGDVMPLLDPFKKYEMSDFRRCCHSPHGHRSSSWRC